MPIRLMIADDHEVVRSGLASLLEGSDIEIVAQAGTGAAAVQMATAKTPDVILLDIRMENGDGLEALEQIRDQCPRTRVIMVSTYDNPTYVARALALGAADYILKGSTREHLLATISKVARGEPSDKSAEVKRVMAAMEKTTGAVEDDISLTKREAQVLRHVALGLSNKEIALSLDISVETVKEHVQNILRKVKAADRTQAAVWAVRKGMV